MNKKFPARLLLPASHKVKFPKTGPPGTLLRECGGEGFPSPIRLPDGEAAEDHAVQSQDLLSYAAPDFRMLSLPDDNPALFLCYGNQVQAAGAMKLFQQPVSGGRTRIDSAVLRTERAQSQIQCIR